ncbi:MAG: HD domain-containing protein [Oscillospiraceae bacterium]|nr:HD domain-containing protein [Oscillospiraceae bacterium]
MKEQFVSLRDAVRAFAGAMNLIDSEISDHHEKVAYFAYQLATALDFPERERKLTFYGALLHDVGSVTMDQGLSLRELEQLPRALARAGASLLRRSEALARLSDIVEASQSPWRKLKLAPEALLRPRLMGQIIHLSDAVALLLKEKEHPLNQVEYIRSCVAQVGEREFHPQVLRAFEEVAGREVVWLDLQYRPEIFLDYVPDDRWLTLEEMKRLTEFMSSIIDFRSPFTAMHSAGVAATAAGLGRLAGMSEAEQAMLRIAGDLHDIGKLKTPRAILEKPGRLTESEFNIMKEHAYDSFRILSEVRGLEQIADWAALHHEKLNGSGYPFHLKGETLSLGSRILAVADVFSAVTEDRPYRKGMDREAAIQVLEGDADRGALSRSLVALLTRHYDELSALRAEASDAAGQRYRESLPAPEEA